MCLNCFERGISSFVTHQEWLSFDLELSRKLTSQKMKYISYKSEMHPSDRVNFYECNACKDIWKLLEPETATDFERGYFLKVDDLSAELNQCDICSKPSAYLLEVDNQMLCPDCKLPYWYAKLSQSQMQTIDHFILKGEIMEAIRAFKTCSGLRLLECIELLHWNFNTLYQFRKKDFECDLESYWEYFIS